VVALVLLQDITELYFDHFGHLSSFSFCPFQGVLMCGAEKRDYSFDKELPIQGLPR